MTFYTWKLISELTLVQKVEIKDNSVKINTGNQFLKKLQQNSNNSHFNPKLTTTKSSSDNFTNSSIK